MNPSYVGTIHINGGTFTQAARDVNQYYGDHPKNAKGTSYSARETERDSRGSYFDDHSTASVDTHSQSASSFSGICDYQRGNTRVNILDSTEYSDDSSELVSDDSISHFGDSAQQIPQMHVVQYVPQTYPQPQAHPQPQAYTQPKYSQQVYYAPQSSNVKHDIPLAPVASPPNTWDRNHRYSPSSPPYDESELNSARNSRHHDTPPSLLPSSGQSSGSYSRRYKSAVECPPIYEQAGRYPTVIPYGNNGGLIIIPPPGVRYKPVGIGRKKQRPKRRLIGNWF